MTGNVPPLLALPSAFDPAREIAEHIETGHPQQPGYRDNKKEEKRGHGQVAIPAYGTSERMRGIYTLGAVAP